MARLRERTSNAKKAAPSISIRAQHIRCVPKVPWFKTDKTVEIHKDRLIIHIYDPKDETEDERKKQKTNVDVLFKKIEDVDLSEHPDGKHGILLIKCRGDVVSAEADVVAPGLMFFFKKEKMGNKGTGEEDRAKLVSALEEANVMINDNFDSSSSSPRSGSNASQEAQAQATNAPNEKGKAQVNDVSVKGATAVDDPQSGPGSPIEDAQPDDMPIPSSQPRKAAILQPQEGQEDDVVPCTNLKSQDGDIKKPSKVAKLKMELRPCSDMMENKIIMKRIKIENLFKNFKKNSKLSLWNSAKAELHHQNIENLNVERVLQDSGSRTEQYGKRYDILLSKHQQACHESKETLKKVLHAIEIQQVNLCQLSISHEKI